MTQLMRQRVEIVEAYDRAPAVRRRACLTGDVAERDDVEVVVGTFVESSLTIR
ncbi:MAG: hypothetical protein WCJ07_10615 [Verrucomicrobiota bacterium]